MRLVHDLKKCIWAIVAVAIIIGSVSFDVQETCKYIEDIRYNSRVSTDEFSVPLRGDISIDATTSIITTATDIKDAGIIRATLRRLGKRPNNKRFFSNILILFLGLFSVMLFFNTLQSVFLWTGIISSRRSIISYIHLQDGAK